MKDTIFNSEITFNCQGNLHTFTSPIIMGIINVTPDSFFSDSRKNSHSDILEQINHFRKHQVDIIDIGGYSSRPGAKDVTEQEELDRVCSAILAIRKTYPELLISIDTFRPKVAHEGIISGANIINDISGGIHDQDIYNIAALHSAPYIMMHMRGTPEICKPNVITTI